MTYINVQPLKKVLVAVATLNPPERGDLNLLDTRMLMLGLH